MIGPTHLTGFVMTDHLHGWTKNNLAQHLISDHGESPGAVPYDADLDAVHAGHHPILERLQLRALQALQAAWPPDGSVAPRGRATALEQQQRVLDAVLPVLQEELSKALDEYADEMALCNDDLAQRQVEGLQTAANFILDPS